MTDLADVQRWAAQLIAQHLDDSWSFGYDNAKRRAGLCNYTTKRISMSRYLTARYSDDDNRQTLLHEIAHALAGHAAAHGPEWKRIARQIGYRGGTTHHGETAAELAPWVGVCPTGHLVYRHRRPQRRSSCSKCARGFNEQFEFRWMRREITAADRRSAAAPRS